jgi:hypothetical protein
MISKIDIVARRIRVIAVLVKIPRCHHHHGQDRTCTSFQLPSCSIWKVSPVRATEISLLCLDRKYNPEDHDHCHSDQFDLKLNVVLNFDNDMVQEVMPCPGGDDLSKIKRKQLLDLSWVQLQLAHT